MRIFRVCFRKESMRLIEKDSYPIPPIFTLMAKEGNIEEQMMYNTYNMGLGMVVAVDPADVDKTMEAMQGSRRYTVCCRQDRSTEKRE